MISTDDLLHTFVIVVSITPCCVTVMLGGVLLKIALYLQKTERGEGKEDSPYSICPTPALPELL